MIKENKLYKTIGFSPSRQVKDLIDFKINRVKKIAPYGAIIDFELKKDEEFRAKIKIKSPYFSYTAKESSPDIFTVLDSIEESISVALGQWKIKRYEQQLMLKVV